MGRGLLKSRGGVLRLGTKGFCLVGGGVAERGGRVLRLVGDLSRIRSVNTPAS